MATKTRVIRRYYGKKRSQRRKGFTLPVAVLAGFVPLIYTTYKHTQWNGVGGSEGGLDVFVRSLTGFSPNGAYGKTWEFKRMMWGAMPILAGLMVHKLAGRLGINRALSSIPVIRL